MPISNHFDDYVLIFSKTQYIHKIFEPIHEIFNIIKSQNTIDNENYKQHNDTYTSSPNRLFVHNDTYPIYQKMFKK